MLNIKKNKSKFITLNYPEIEHNNVLKKDIKNIIERIRYYVNKHSWEISMYIIGAQYSNKDGDNTNKKLVWRDKKINKERTQGRPEEKLFVLGPATKEKSHIHSIVIGKPINKATNKIRKYWLKTLNERYNLNLNKVNENEKLIDFRGIKNITELKYKIHYCENQSVPGIKRTLKFDKYLYLKDI